MKKGFTIIELVIVISVLIILIGIAIPHMKGMQQSGQVVKAKGELQTLQAAMESYYSNNNNTYPLTSGSTAPSATFIAATPQILSSTLYDPFVAGGATQYDAIYNNGYYAFGSVGLGTGLGSFTISTTGVVSGTGGGLCVTNGSGC